jgi:antitoxin component of MazEF toxin-antitoxin module
MQDIIVKNCIKPNALGSCSLILPARMIRKLNIVAGTPLEIKLEGSSLIVSKYVGE